MSAYSANVISEELRGLKVMAVAYVSLSNHSFSIMKKIRSPSCIIFFLCIWSSLIFFLCFLTAKAGKQYYLYQVDAHMLVITLPKTLCYIKTI